MHPDSDSLHKYPKNSKAIEFMILIIVFSLHKQNSAIINIKMIGNPDL
jgi:hypothetical protein